MPQELDELQRKIMQLQIEETALKQEEDKKAIERREDIQQELAQLQSQRDELYTNGKMRKHSWRKARMPRCAWRRHVWTWNRRRMKPVMRKRPSCNMASSRSWRNRSAKRQRTQKEDALIQETVNEETIATHRRPNGPVSK